MPSPKDSRSLKWIVFIEPAEPQGPHPERRAGRDPGRDPERDRGRPGRGQAACQAGRRARQNDVAWVQVQMHHPVTICRAEPLGQPLRCRQGMRPVVQAAQLPAERGPDRWALGVSRGIRLQAGKRFATGEETAMIAKGLWVSLRLVERWRCAWREGGMEALQRNGASVLDEYKRWAGGWTPWTSPPAGGDCQGVSVAGPNGLSGRGRAAVGTAPNRTGPSP
ncbi:hypothetical protein GCM10009730_51000 [Streptomyces albidochromogenes]